MTVPQVARSGIPVTPTNPVRAMNPLTQVFLVAAATVIGLFFGPVYLGVFFLVALLVLAVAGRAWPFLKIFTVAMVPMALLMFVLQLFFSGQGTKVLWRWWIFEATRGGLDNAITFVSRILVIAVGVLLLTQICDLQRFSRDLEQRGVSNRVTYVLQSTFMILPEMQKRSATIMDAQRARGIETDANLLVRAKAFLPAVAPLILSSLTGVEERAMSLEARGMTLDGPRTSLLHVRDSAVDKLLRVLAVLAVLGFFGWKVWMWTR